MANYYDILGVSKSASEAEIKSSYRKLALKYHPDRNPGDKRKAAEDKFKEISEAYAVLSDKDKKKQYDTFGDSSFHQQYSSEDIFRGVDFGSIFNDLGGMNGRGKGSFSGGFRSSSAGGGVGFEDIFSAIFGGGGMGGGMGGASQYSGSARRNAPLQQGQDLEYPVQIGFMDAYNGTKRRVQFQLSDGSSSDITVSIPAGVADKTKLRVAGKGANGGDLYVIIQVGSHPSFVRNGNDIETTVQLNISDALLGCSVEVPVPDGGTKKIKIPPCVAPGTKIRLKELGFPVEIKSKKRANLFAVVTYNIPDKLSNAQKDLLLQFKQNGL